MLPTKRAAKRWTPTRAHAALARASDGAEAPQSVKSLLLRALDLLTPRSGQAAPLARASTAQGALVDRARSRRPQADPQRDAAPPLRCEASRHSERTVRRRRMRAHMASECPARAAAAAGALRNVTCALCIVRRVRGAGILFTIPNVHVCCWRHSRRASDSGSLRSRSCLKAPPAHPPRSPPGARCTSPRGPSSSSEGCARSSRRRPL